MPTWIPQLVGFTHMVPDPIVAQRLYGQIMEFMSLALDAPPRAR